MVKTKLREYLERNDISVEKLAFETGLKFTTTYHIVNGYCNPSKKKIDKILQQLNCKYEDIF